MQEKSRSFARPIDKMLQFITFFSLKYRKRAKQNGGGGVDGGEGGKCPITTSPIDPPNDVSALIFRRTSIINHLVLHARWLSK